jgi:hypothetical protein
MVAKNNLLVSIVVLFAFVFAVPVPELNNPVQKDNLAPRKDNFSKWPDFGEGYDWRYYVVNGNHGSISVNNTLPFDNSMAEVTAGKELRFFQVYDPDFDDEYPGQYNNIFMIGFQGYVPNTERDILWNFDMKIEPDTYGSTGFVIERKDTFAADGSVALPFDFFGVGYAGPESYHAGLRCMDMVDFTLISQDLIAGVDPFAWNAYEIRFHLLDSATIQASISVNGTEVCQASRANYGETEIQIWLDNYKLTYDPLNPQDYSLGYYNKETPQAVLFDDIEAKAKPVH